MVSHIFIELQFRAGTPDIGSQQALSAEENLPGTDLRRLVLIVDGEKQLYLSIKHLLLGSEVTVSELILPLSLLHSLHRELGIARGRGRTS